MTTPSDTETHREGEAADRPDSLAAQLSQIKFLGPYMWRPEPKDFRPRIVLSLVVIIVGQVLTVATPFALAAAINRLAEDQPDRALLYVALGFILGYAILRFLGTAIPQLREFLFSRVSLTAKREVAVDVFTHLQRLSLRYHLERRTGSLSRIIERGIRAIDFIFRFLLFNIGPTLLQLILVAIIFGVRYNPLMILVAVGTVVGYIWFTVQSTEYRLKFRREMNETDQLGNARAVDALLNYETVRYFGAADREAARYNDAMVSYQEAAIRSQNSLAILNIGQALIVNVGLAFALLLTAQGVADGRYGIGEITGVGLIMIQLYQPLNILGFAYREIKQSLVDMEKMFSLLGISPEVKDKLDAPALAVHGGAVRFEGVGFGYDDRRSILKDLSFNVAPGEKVAIVGPSGAGKSTIARLLFRFYDVTSGGVFIDGQNIADVTQSSVQDAIGIVPQDTVLFNDTIGYNIAYGCPKADDADIARAAGLAQIDRFIAALPDKYDTVVGERGLKLSGGEKQRVAIARTILKDPPILILDEATSALDSATEEGIIGALDEVSKDRTTLIIAHRLSTVVKADRILVLEAGTLVEEGSHDQLLSLGGVYADLWARQQKGAGETAHEQGEAMS